MSASAEVKTPGEKLAVRVQTGGAELIVQATRHIAVVPQFRVLGIDRGSVTSGSPFPSFGLGFFVYTGGIGVRAAF